MPEPINIMWFRRDLRLHDNAALYHALKSENPVLPIFIFDKNILGELDEKHDRRVEFIRDALENMQSILIKYKSSLQAFYGTPEEAFKQLLKNYTVIKVFANHDADPYALVRDKEIKALLVKNKVEFNTYKDHVIFEKDEVVKDDGKPYTVFTPYSKRWKANLKPFHLKPYPTEKYFENLFKDSTHKIPSLESMGFKEVGKPFPSEKLDETIVKHYTKDRDYPGVDGTSRMGVHLRFGTVSIRELAAKAKELNETYLNELIWRDFYHMILHHFPHVGLGHAFKKEYDKIEWKNDKKQFEAWCKGQTGYPIVDAGMRQLNEIGFMHNRVRMITASFLTKHLLIDWRWGEAYFAEKLLDYELASNNGGWQWAAGSGCDAAPYFRVFNPTLQTQRFDPDFKYIRKWVPEFEGFDYPKPIVVHEEARKRVIEVYKKALNVVLNSNKIV